MCNLLYPILCIPCILYQIYHILYPIFREYNIGIENYCRLKFRCLIEIEYEIFKNNNMETISYSAKPSFSWFPSDLYNRVHDKIALEQLHTLHSKPAWFVFFEATFHILKKIGGCRRLFCYFRNQLSIDISLKTMIFFFQPLRVFTSKCALSIWDRNALLVEGMREIGMYLSIAYIALWRWSSESVFLPSLQYNFM